MSRILRIIGACQDDFRISKYYANSKDLSSSSSFSNYDSKHFRSRSRSLSSLPVPKKRKNKFRKVKSLNNLFIK